MPRQAESRFMQLHRCIVAACSLGMSAVASADGFVVDKIYSPYVNSIEREIELRTVIINDDDELIDGSKDYRLGFAHAFAQRFRGELYLIGADVPGENLSLDAYELELKWQLSEQGEYFADWGLLFELETERDEDIQEFSSTVLVEKEFGRWNGLLNLAAVYEWGDDIENEWESQLSAQLRYRYKPMFEPAVELYAGELFKGMGPVGLGQFRVGVGKKIRWQLGLIFALDSKSPEQIYRGMLEYEF